MLDRAISPLPAVQDVKQLIKMKQATKGVLFACFTYHRRSDDDVEISGAV